MSKHLDILTEAYEALDDAVDFMQTFEGMPESLGCVCDDEDEGYCTCINEDGEHARITESKKTLDRIRIALKEMSQETKGSV